ncbi:hypothetical protein AVEN_231976-1 [Araneus ventricosus]|uniref:Uncharacterized protein n=1 Tax=Araneus ventricosus TaxID=182803 RepID=A0A4Y2C3C9_ARAVE|nr:hypothetical protein AVEN_231976-1 [Araneus ventricosus]
MEEIILEVDLEEEYQKLQVQKRTQPTSPVRVAIRTTRTLDHAPNAILPSTRSRYWIRIPTPELRVVFAVFDVVVGKNRKWTIESENVWDIMVDLRPSSSVQVRSEMHQLTFHFEVKFFD